MGLVRFMTVYDDDMEEVLSLNNCRSLDISAQSVFYKSGKYSFLENLNTDASNFMSLKNSGIEYTLPTVPASVFHYSLEKLRDMGYLAAFIVCPHAKWLPYYKEAVHAAKNINRTAKRQNDQYFNVHVVNSKAFGIGSVLFANTLALDFYHNRNSTKIIADYSTRYANSSTTYVLTENDTVFGNARELTAYRITNTRVFSVDISKSVDAVKYDRFAKTVAMAIKRAGGRYAVSYGFNCSFHGNIIGRLIRDYNHYPLVKSQYGIATTQILGSKTLCIHLGEYI